MKGKWGEDEMVEHHLMAAKAWLEQIKPLRMDMVAHHLECRRAWEEQLERNQLVD